MNKEELNIVNYVIAITNNVNTNKYNLYYNLVKFLVDSFEYKNIDYKFINEEIENFVLIELNYKKLALQLEYNKKENVLYLLNITKTK